MQIATSAVTAGGSWEAVSGLGNANTGGNGRLGVEQLPPAFHNGVL